MRLIKPSYNILTNFDLYKNKTKQELIDIAYKEIEVAGRTCYKSEENMTPDSAISFVNKMIKSGHGAMLEHGTIYLHIKPEDSINGFKYRDNKYSKFIEIRELEIPSPRLQRYITTNLRVLVENNWLDDLQYICEPTEYHEKRISVRFIMDRIGSQSFVRHRVFSFAQESTRYCNYSKDKFSNELVFIIPNWCSNIKENFEYDSINIPKLYFEEKIITSSERKWLFHMYNSEVMYLGIINTENDKWIPQQARSVLPNSLKTELIMTGLISDWEHFFSLRCPSSAHPQAKELAIPLSEDMKKLLK